MKIVFRIVLTVWLLLALPAVNSEAKNTKFHPRNVELIKKGVIPPMKFFPEVPRITAEEAMGLLMSNRGFFIAIGSDSKVMQGGLSLHNYMQFNPKRLKLPKGKIIVTYCG